MVDRLTRAAAVLSGYADELDAAQRSAATLQASWDRVLPSDPLAPLPEAALAAVAGTIRRDVGRPAARRRRRRAPAARARGRGGGGGPARGGRDSRPSAGPTRPRRRPRCAGRCWPGSRSCRVPSGAVRRATSPTRPSSTWPPSPTATWAPSGGSSTGSGPTAGTRWPPSRCGRASIPRPSAAPWIRWRGPVTATASPACSPPSGSRWRRPPTRPTRSGSTPSPERGSTRGASRGSWPWPRRSPPRLRGAVGGPVGGAWVQGRLLTAICQSGLSPGPRYASTVAVAVVAADRAWAASGFRPAAVRAGPGRLADDPVVALARALENDAAAARDWLLAPLPGSDRRLVVEQLVAGRYRSTDPPSRRRR